MIQLWEYRAQIMSVFDGDSCRADIDLGFGVWRRDEPLRLLGINAPEVRGPERELGLVSRDALRDRVLGSVVYLRTVKPTTDNFPGQDMRDKYGRYLAVIWSVDGDSINDWMVGAGFATSYWP